MLKFVAIFLSLVLVGCAGNVADGNGHRNSWIYLAYINNEKILPLDEVGVLRLGSYLTVSEIDGSAPSKQIRLIKKFSFSNFGFGKVPVNQYHFLPGKHVITFSFQKEISPGNWVVSKDKVLKGFDFANGSIFSTSLTFKGNDKWDVNVIEQPDQRESVQKELDYALSN